MSFNFLYIVLNQDPEIAPLELGNIMEPDPIAFSFNTVGWKVVFVILMLLVLYGTFKLYLKYKHNQYRRDAIAEIESLKQDAKLPEMQFITKLVFILKRTALQTYHREKVASLKGDAWLEFLDTEVSGSNFKKYKEDIAHAVYQETFDNTRFNKEEFFQMSLKWIKNHA